MDNIKITVIVPFYNNYNDMGECIDYFSRQSSQNIEVLLINDGSSEVLPTYIEEKINNDNRIFLYSKSHAGPSAARNFGIKKATGDYILFMDSDDKLESNAINCLLKTCQQYGQVEKLDIIIFGFILYRKKQYVSKNHTAFFNGKKDDFMGESFYHCYREYLINAPWNKLIRKELLMNEQIYFDEKLFILEDLLFSLHVIQKSNKIVVLEDCLYHYYYMNEGSLSSKFQVDKVDSLIRVCQIILDETKYFKKYHPYYCNNISMKIILQVKDILDNKLLSRQQKKDLLSNIIRSKEVYQIIKLSKSESFKEVIKRRAFLIAHRLFA